MEVAASDAAGRGVSLPMSSSFRRDWHVIPEQSLRNSANEVLFSVNFYLHLLDLISTFWVLIHIKTNLLLHCI